MHDKARLHFVGVRVDPVHALNVEHGRAPLDAVDHVAFRQKKPGEVGTVLSCNSGNQGSLQLDDFIRTE